MAKGKGQKSGPKKQDQSAQKDKTIAMLKESLAKAQAENAQLRGDAPPPTKQGYKQEPPPAAANGKAGQKKKPKTPAKQRPVSPQPALAPVDEGHTCTLVLPHPIIVYIENSHRHRK